MVRYIVRGKGTLGWAYTVWTLSALAFGVSAWNGGWREALWALPIAAIAVLLGYVIYWNPRIEIDDEQVQVINIVRKYFIPWEDLESIETRFGLYLYAHHLRRKISVWAVPSRASFFRKEELKATSGRKDSLGCDDDANTFLQWNIEPGTYRRVMNLSDIAEQLRERRAEIYKKLGQTRTHTQRDQAEHAAEDVTLIPPNQGSTSGFPQFPSLGLSEQQLKQAGREYAEAVGKTSSSELNIPNFIALSAAALLTIFMLLPLS